MYVKRAQVFSTQAKIAPNSSGGNHIKDCMVEEFLSFALNVVTMVVRTVPQRVPTIEVHGLVRYPFDVQVV